MLCSCKTSMCLCAASVKGKEVLKSKWRLRYSKILRNTTKDVESGGQITRIVKISNSSLRG